jgi:PucR family transcriptional regulator, purine catabolism regulatory protein
MPLTVGQVAALPELGLLVRTSTPALDREVRWVAVSELADPTPWIEGGDLLLTTGMTLADDLKASRVYVDRLVAADVAALGFGVGLSHQTVPSTLVAAAERAGLPLLEVPQPVPFVALSKAVSRLLTAEEYAESAASFESQRRLIRAALADPGALADPAGHPEPRGRSGQSGIVPVLAKHVGGFVLHLSSAGEVVAAHPAGASARAAELAGEVDRLRPRGLLASASIATSDEHVVILPIGVKGAAEGFLVVGSTRPLRSADQAVMNLAVSLLSWAASRPLARDEGMNPWRRLLVSVVQEHGLTDDLVGALGLGDLRPARAVAVTVRGASGRSVPDAVLSAANGSGPAVLCRRAYGDLGGFAGVDDDGSLPAALRALATLPEVGALGVSCVLDLTDPANVRQAVEQADRAAALGTGLQHFADEPARGITSLVDAATTTAWAVGYLGNLMTTGEGPELMETLRAWLDEHGQVDAAAQQLGIHRHTVRHRLRRAEGVLGRRLDDPSVRADLWFALAAVRPDGPVGAPQAVEGRG